MVTINIFSGRFFVTVLAILSVFAFFAPDTDISDSLIRELSLREEANDALKSEIRIKTTSILLFF